MVVLALEGTYASVIGGAPAAAVVFAREVEKRTRADARAKELQQAVDQAEGAEKARLQARLSGLLRAVQSEKLGEVADEFDHVHSVERALRVHSIDEIIPAAALRPRLIEAIEQGMKRETEPLPFPPLAAVTV
jgi:acetyl-CoA carboxylase carboxyltransferase component